MALSDVTPIAPADIEAKVKSAERAFGFSLIFSGVRCTLQYIILPFILPIFGIAGDAAAPLLLAINLLAILSIFASLRRFWRINYRYKWHYLAFSSVILAVLTMFILTDLFPATFEAL